MINYLRELLYLSLDYAVIFGTMLVTYAMAMAVMESWKKQTDLEIDFALKHPKKPDNLPEDAFKCYEVIVASGEETFVEGVMAQNSEDAMDVAERSIAEGRHVLNPIAIAIKRVERI